MSEHNQHPQHDNSNRRSIWHIFFSAIAAAFGVQSDKNRQKDFAHSSPWPYIFAGLAFTLAFILALVVIVNIAIG